MAVFGCLAVFGCCCRLRREIYVSQNWPKGWNMATCVCVQQADLMLSRCALSLAGASIQFMKVNLRTRILDFRGFDSSTISILREFPGP